MIDGSLVLNELNGSIMSPETNCLGSYISAERFTMEVRRLVSCLSEKACRRVWVACAAPPTSVPPRSKLPSCVTLSRDGPRPLLSTLNRLLKTAPHFSFD
jgi:hypothetical protein